MQTTKSTEQKRDELRQAALDYHERPIPGKITIAATKQLVNQHDLALAYSPGVAFPCEEIVKDPNNAFKYTARGNLVAVITNGTAVLGLGDIGPLASKPVMEGKAVLFKKFAGIDVFDIEINEKNDLDKLVDIIAALEPTFGGINLEDIKAPDCFYVERKLSERMKIPVFHDDQHGTAICVGAAILNGLKVVGKDPKDIKLVTSGAGAAALACLGLLVKLGIPQKNIFVTDLAGVVYEGRIELMDEDKIIYLPGDVALKLFENVPLVSKDQVKFSVWERAFLNRFPRLPGDYSNRCGKCGGDQNRYVWRGTKQHETADQRCQQKGYDQHGAGKRYFGSYNMAFLHS